MALGLIVGGLLFYQQAVLSARVQAQVRVITAVVSETRALFRRAEFPSYAVLDDVLIAAGAVPREAVAATPTVVYSMSSAPSVPARLRTVWDTPMLADFVTGVPNATLAGPGRVYVRRSLFNIPVAACARLAVVDRGGGGIAVGTGRVGFRTPAPSGYGPTSPVVGTEVDIGAPLGTPFSLPGVYQVTPALASERCQLHSTNGVAILVLSYFIDAL